MNQKKMFYLERVAAIIAAAILIQTLYFKFSAHPDSVHIFTRIGGEPYLRIFSGFVELIIGLLLIFRKTSHYGAFLGFILMLGAIGQHLFVLGINVNDDGGTLFALALTTLFCCSLVLVAKRQTIQKLYKKQSGHEGA
jgi:hypothetical protein